MGPRSYSLSPLLRLLGLLQRASLVRGYVRWLPHSRTILYKLSKLLRRCWRWDKSKPSRAQVTFAVRLSGVRHAFLSVILKGWFMGLHSRMIRTMKVGTSLTWYMSLDGRPDLASHPRKEVQALLLCTAIHLKHLSRVWSHLTPTWRMRHHYRRNPPVIFRAHRRPRPSPVQKALSRQ